MPDRNTSRAEGTVRIPRLLQLASIFAGTLAWAAITSAAVIGDRPAIATHVDQRAVDDGKVSFEVLFDAGKRLFIAKFNRLDGQGRPGTTGSGAPRAIGSAPAFIRTSGPDANSCAGCHNEPAAGGSGDIVANVFVLAQTLDPVTQSVSDEFSNERNTLGMHGSGPIEMLAREMTAELRGIRDAAARQASTSGVSATRPLIAKGVSFGSITVSPAGQVDSSKVVGVDGDLVIRPFHQKGVVVSLREFSNNAFNHHHGMQSVERFGPARTGSSDFDRDGVQDELLAGDITASVIFQAALNTPGQVIPDDASVATAIIRGERTFSRVGCAECHVPEMKLESPLFSEPNPYNPEGNLRPADVSRSYTFDLAKQGQAPRPDRAHDGRLIVRAFTDLKRHDLCDKDFTFYCNEKVVQAGVSTRQFVTRKLWDAGSSAPYGHRGDLSTLGEAIHHHGGEARPSRDAFVSLPEKDRSEVIEFLLSLQVLPEGTPALVVNEQRQPVDKRALIEDVLGVRSRATRH